MTYFQPLDDVDDDGHPEVVPANFSSSARLIGGASGSIVWSTPLLDKPASVTIDEESLQELRSLGYLN